MTGEREDKEMFRYLSIFNEYEIYESNSFKGIYKATIHDGIWSVKNKGYSHILRIIDQKTDKTICSFFFNQRHDEIGTEYSYVRVKSCTNTRNSIPTRRFKID